MKFPYLNEVTRLVADGYVSARRHPRLPLVIYNYTPKATYEFSAPSWPEPLALCRGLVLDDEGNIVGRSYKKFWNYSQVMDIIPDSGEPDLLEKVDGSLILAFMYHGELVVASRGSFESDQAKHAAAIIQKMEALTSGPFYQYWFNVESGYTAVFEVVYPENRVVVDYGDTDQLVLLDVIENDTGRHNDNLKCLLYDAWSFSDSAQRFIRYADICQTSIADASVSAKENVEGYVARWPCGFRAKIKLAEYVRLHRLMYCVSSTTIWENLRSGLPMDELLDRVPSAFKDWVEGTRNSLIFQYRTVEETCQYVLDSLSHLKHDRKAFAGEVKQYSCFPQVVFLMLDGKLYSDTIWKAVRPKWSTPFKKGVQE